jgi:hypothetical protein
MEGRDTNNRVYSIKALLTSIEDQDGGVWLTLLVGIGENS